jgi:hypothetical protein
MIARPGKMHSHGAERIYGRPSESMAPHSGIGGATPTPRKLREEAAMMLLPIASVTCTMMGDRQFGMMCLRMTFQVGRPIA